MATPKLALTDLTNKQANAEVPVNLNMRHLETFAVLNVLATQNAPPGSPANGDTYIVGAAGSGAWSGHNNQITAYQSGWYFWTPFSGIRAYDATAGESLGYNTTHGWFPMQPRWSTTEHWTGIYHGGAVGSTNRVYSKTFSFTLPNNTTQNTAHSISNLDLGTGKLLTIEAIASTGTTAWQMPLFSATQTCAINVTATNIVTISNFNASTHTALIRLCYRKTV